MPQLKSKLSLNKAVIIVTVGILLSGCSNTTSQTESSADPRPTPIVAEFSAKAGEKGLSHEKLMSIAARAWERRNVSTALRLYNMAAQKKPTNVTPYLAMAKILRKTKRTDAAVEIYNSVIDHKPNLVEAHTGLGYSLLDLSKPYLAAQSFEAAIIIDPKNPRSLGGMAVALDTAGEHGKAQNYYRLAIKADTNNLIYQNNLALSLALVGRLDQAIAMFEIITAHPNAIAQHRQNLALVYGMAGKSADAMRYSRMDLSETDARNNALYFQALNSEPNTPPSNEERQALLMKKEKHAKERSLKTSRQPYESLMARSEYTELKTKIALPIKAEKSPVMGQQNYEVHHARVPLTATELMKSAKVRNSTAQKVAAAPLSPVIKPQLSAPAFLPKADAQLPRLITPALADQATPNNTIKPIKGHIVSSFSNGNKIGTGNNVAITSTQSYFAQLGSFRSRERAIIGWTQLLATHFDLLADYQPVFTKADLGAEKGIFYRVRIGSFSNKKIPLSLCQQLRDRAQDCYMPVVSTNASDIFNKFPNTKIIADGSLREANLKKEAPFGTPFLISYNNERIASHRALYSTIASY